MSEYDVIILGGGHNGLVAASYLAAAGQKVVIAEKNDFVGGPAARREFLPGYFSTITNSPGSLEPMIVNDMKLEEFGLKFVRPNPTLVHPLEDSQPFIGWRERERTEAILESFRPGESSRYNAFNDYLQKFANRLGISLFREPPTLKELVRNLDAIEDQEAFSRIVLGSARELFEYFELSPQSQSLLSPLAVVSGIVGPSTPGTPFNLMMRPLSLASLAATEEDDPRRMPLRGSTGLPVGGMGAIIDAMEASVTAQGVTILRNKAADRIYTRGGKVAGVSFADGTELVAPIVISAMNPHLTVDILESDDERWTAVAQKRRTQPLRGKAFKVVLALDDFPRYTFAGNEDEARALAAAQLRVAPSIRYLEESYADMLLGRVPENPVIWGLCSSMTSPGLAPEGKHVLSLNIGNAPYNLTGTTWADERDRLFSRVLDILEQWIPNIRGIVSDYAMLDADEFETEYGLVQANISHGDMLPFRQFWMRPFPGLQNYRTYTDGLYLSGNGCWPGNFVSGIAGHNTARAVLRDMAGTSGGVHAMTQG
ncbi:Phytoene dehydrogenase-related protein [Lutimaribacter pacificus]|uniref:Pyridine nucleotide-disulfide oxidoreductase domain-containing protein 2 n=1 Tax=Lutimaribacter pacificus TaxID=391948 RepID=A0A1H0L9G9_9RHOB|nr:NAD(P)/FAD-dependent oxidoreductase [Lutimaribacter pacificus]SDO64631.1 Phytoene dehydrogenase-related protein [Lutimaribacter pacificus]SHK69897.1 Phytoene dehydrogenase-related protein [Lutimaribacter pacificus]